MLRFSGCGDGGEEIRDGGALGVKERQGVVEDGAREPGERLLGGAAGGDPGAFGGEPGDPRLERGSDLGAFEAGEPGEGAEIGVSTMLRCREGSEGVGPPCVEPGPGRDVERAGRPAPRGLVATGRDESRFLEPAEHVVDRREGDVGPLAHAALSDDLFDLVAVAGLLREESEDRTFGGGGGSWAGHVYTLALE